MLVGFFLFFGGFCDVWVDREIGEGKEEKGYVGDNLVDVEGEGDFDGAAKAT